MVNRIEKGELPTALTSYFTVGQRMVYYLFWTAYSTKVNKKDFQEFFGADIDKIYKFEIWLAQKMGFIITDGLDYKMTLKGAFYYHYYESYYTLSYIDKMWEILSKNAFPDEIFL